MPHMKPVPMETKSKGFFGGIVLWLFTTRKWCITEDWKFSLQMDGQKTVTSYLIPKGFIFDGASVPKPMRSWLSPMGILLSGGLVHDYVYKFETLRLTGKKPKAIPKKIKNGQISCSGIYALMSMASKLLIILLIML